LTLLVKSLSDSEWSALLQDAQIIEADGLGLKVARLPNGDFIKLFRRKRWLSSALWSPPAQRFATNASQLILLNIAAPQVSEMLALPEGQSAVRYLPLPGQTLRERWTQLSAQDRAFEVRQFGHFLGVLHQNGVYFRSLHLGNVLHLPDNHFGLIDLADMSISHRPLSRFKRRRNLKHLLRYEGDANWLLKQHKDYWLSGYAQSAGNKAAAKLAKALAKKVIN